MTLLNWGGPRVHDFVSVNLCGPHHRTTSRHRSKDAYFRASKLSANVDGVSVLKCGRWVRHLMGVSTAMALLFAPDVDMQGLTVLSEYKQDKLPLVIANDATAVAPRLDISVRGEEIWVYGLCGGEVQVESVLHLQELVKSHGLAQQLDVYVAIVSVPHGMHLPVFANATNGKLKATDVRRNMELVFSELEARGAVVMAHVADGASTNRQV